MKKWMIALLAGSLLIPCLPAAAETGINVEGQIISFETTDIDGNAVTSEELFKDNKITMINLWGIWCIHCVNEIEELTRLQTSLQEKGCGIVGLELENAPIDTITDEIHAFMDEKGMNYPNAALPVDNEIFRQVIGFPTSFFVDSTGKILTDPIIGAQVDQYEPTIDRLLADMDTEAADNAGAGAVKNDIGKYRVIVCDQEGDPVEGAVIQFCDEASCSFQPTDAEGAAAFSIDEQKVYDIHVLTVPEGYAADEEVYKTLDTWSDVTIILEKTA